MNDPAGWDGILDAGENILWQGRPDGAVHFGVGNLPVVLFGLAFSAFALVWMIMASQAGGFFWMFGLLHFAVGIGLAFGAIWWDAYKRRHTWYSLTDRRAFIATDLPLFGRRLQSYPIEKDTALNYTPGSPGAIHFAHETRRSSNGRHRTVEIGFEFISEGDTVYTLMRDIQKGDAT